MFDIIHITGLPEALTAIPRSPDQNAAFVYLASLPARSGRKTQKQVLTKIASWLGGTPGSVEWGNLRYAHTIAIKTRVLNEGYSPASARKFLSALRGTLKAAWRLNQIPADEYAKAIDLGRIGGKTLPAGRYVHEEEMARIFECCLKDTSGIGARDAAVIAILYGCGLRREEIVSLEIKDYSAQDGTLTVHGKRDKDRLAYVTNGTRDALEDWLKVRGPKNGPLFLAISKFHAIRENRRLSNQAIYNLIEKRLKEAGLEHFSPHSLRRSFCSNLLDAGVDISTAKNLMGHESIATTGLYDRRPERTQRKGVELLHIPYKRPDRESEDEKNLQDTPA